MAAVISLTAHQPRCLTEGDIYRWQWKDDERHSDSAPYRSYHCKSRIAVVKNGQIFDTFWHGSGSDGYLDPEAIILTHWANIADLTEIKSYQVPYYRRDDIVDLRHSNNSSGPIYRRSAAQKDAGSMLEEVQYRAEEARSKIRSATYDLERWAKSEALIRAGLIDEVHL